METEKREPAVCVGGAYDRKRHAAPPGVKHFYTQRPLTMSERWASDDPGPAGVIKTTIERYDRQDMRVVDPDGRVIDLPFWRHESLSLAQAMERLLTVYATPEGQ